MPMTNRFRSSGAEGQVIIFGYATGGCACERIEEHGAEGSEFDVLGGQTGRAKLPLVGKHNVNNALAGLRWA